MYLNHKLSFLFQLIIKWQAKLFKNLIYIDLQGHTALNIEIPLPYSAFV